jgi:ABC-type antimicrobial peptide transport system permease subunit
VIAVRTQGHPGAITNAVRTAILGLDSALPVYDVALLEDRLAAQDDASLALTVVTGSYAVLALFLASLGLFGILAHTVGRRTQELGIRMALGAAPSDLLLMVLREGIMLTILGIVGGTIGALFLTRVMASLLFGISPTDPVVYVAISALLLAVSIAACYLPARRATRVDPVVALRNE